MQFQTFLANFLSLKVPSGPGLPTFMEQNAVDYGFRYAYFINHLFLIVIKFSTQV